MFDLVLVQYDAGGEVCKAPYLALKEGDIVETSFGRGKVVKKVSTYDGDEVYQFFNYAKTISRVISVMRPLEYKDVDL